MVRQLKQIILKRKFPIFLIILLSVLCNYCMAQSTEIDSLKRVLKATKIDTSKVNIYNHIADKFKESNPDSTAFYAQKAAALSLKLKYDFGLANSYINTGNSNIILGNYKIAISEFKKAQLKFQSLVALDGENKFFKTGLARTYASCGVIYSQESNYYLALENYQKALKIYIDIDQKNSISKAYNNIGIVYKSQLNHTKALEYFKKAFTIQQEIGEQTAPVTLTNIGVIYFENKKYAEALNYYTKAKKLYKNIDNKRGFALLNNYFGDYYRSQNDNTTALSYYTTSLNLYEEMQNKF